MNTISVSKDSEANEGLMQLAIDDILYIEYSRKPDRIIFHTMQEMYYSLGTLTYWQNALCNSGFNFRLVDRTNVINLDKIVQMDGVFHVAYFEEQITSQSKRCTMTHVRFEEIRKLLGIDTTSIVWR
ncbi:LytTR family transcriptional regulator DNA-binding domain-containing protein [Paenibacillus sp. sgz500958]|uniref:LytTR family transcriptional regulator DNA-binding domain-containing protein n=1 Tax=Paenibacillus sp. sgz500958 TaxID=3242475 RepID=UPI0036D247D0